MASELLNVWQLFDYIVVSYMSFMVSPVTPST